MPSLKVGLARFGWRSGLLQMLLKHRRQQPMILMYHGVSAQDKFDGLRNAAELHLPRTHFVEHLRLLKKVRRIVGISEFVHGLQHGEDLRNTVVLTFDDGYENNASQAAPVLADHKIPASFFLATNHIGSNRWIWTDIVEHVLGTSTRPHFDWQGVNLPLATIGQRREALQRVKADLKRLTVIDRDTQVARISQSLDVPIGRPFDDYRFMDWEQVRSLVRAGFEVGAHTRHHAILSRLPPHEAEEEILGSRRDVEEATGQCCSVFCYPNGKRSDFTLETQAICRSAFAAAITTEHGSPDAQRLFELPRYSAGGDGAALSMNLMRAA